MIDRPEIKLTSLRSPQIIGTKGAGDTYGNLPWRRGFWKELSLEQAYSGMRSYNAKQGYFDIFFTHVRAMVNDLEFVEATTPHARLGETTELLGKRIWVATPLHEFDEADYVDFLIDYAKRKVPYDYAELGDFHVSRLLGFTLRRMGVFDKVNRFVCSTLIGKGLEIGNYPLTIRGRAMTPAHPFNSPDQWSVESGFLVL